MAGAERPLNEAEQKILGEVAADPGVGDDLRAEAMFVLEGVDDSGDGTEGGEQTPATG